VNEPFEDLVDQAYEIVKEFGVSRLQIETDMQGIKEQMERPGCNHEMITKAFLDGLRRVFEALPTGQATTGESTNGSPEV
jgi:hypothetical protein